MTRRASKPRGMNIRRRQVRDSRDLVKTRVMGWVALLTGVLVGAFAAYGMIAGDHEVLSEVWSCVKVAAVAIMAWAGGGGFRRP
jgi:hypothetical protein